MSLEAEFTLESDELLLGRLLTEYPTLTFQLERVVPVGERVMPYVWVYGSGIDSFASDLAETPEVAEITELDRLNDSALYRIEWESDVERVVAGMAKTGGTIVEAHGDSAWTFRVRFEDHTDLAAFHRYCTIHDIDSSLRRVYTVADPRAGESTFGLTAPQREALVAALESDYFDVPRGVTLTDLSEEVDISEQAMSERLRRGTRKVLEIALGHQPPPSAPP